MKSEKLYKHHPELITEVKKATILLNFTIQTDWKIKTSTQDLVVKKNIPSNWYVNTDQ